MKNVLLGMLLGAVVAFTARPLQAATTPTWTFHPSGEDRTACPGVADACDAWVKFRSTHPWPYQTYAIGRRNGRVVVISSEPPPGFGRADLERLIRAVFGSQLESMGRYRWATGIDGWLEDIVFTLKPSGAGKALPVLGPDLRTWQAPFDAVEGLKYVDAALHGTADGFWMENLDQPVTSAPIPSVNIRPADVAAWLAGAGAWTPLSRSVDAPLSWSAMLARSAAYRSEDDTLVALVLQNGAALNAARADFRRFALESDMLVAAVRDPAGRFVLLGRRRQVPLSDLPPLRFETFASLAARQSDELAQSYERQRVFAGKIQTGAFAQWDWAPILLSKQLEDSEFGTLLNEADQLLKSWSQAGEVRYLDFLAKPPAAYPFGVQPVSALAETDLDAPGIIFNWNTQGYSVITQQPAGRVLTADRSGALPVLYLPLGAGARAVKDPEKQAAQWSKTGRDYFDALGHPLVVRVAQNTFLYQAVNNLLTTSAQVSEGGRSRTERATAAIQAEAKAWITSLATGPQATDPEKLTVQRAVKRLLATPGMTPDQAAALLATSQASASTLTRMANQDHALKAEFDRLGDEEAQRKVEYAKAYEAACAEALRLGGTRLKDECDVRAPPEKIQTFHALKAKALALVSEINGLKADKARVVLEHNALGLAYSQALDNYNFAQALGRKIAQSAQAVADLDQVKDRVLAAAARDQTIGSIRTPTLVLSRNEVEMWAIGGHNVGGRPPIVVADAPRPGPTLRKVRPAMAVEPGVTRISAGLPTVTAEGVASGHIGAAIPPRPAAEALATRPEAPKSMLSLVRARAPLSPELGQPVLDRLRACGDCRAVIDHIGGDTYVVAKRPPMAGRIEMVQGGSGLIDVLAEAREGGQLVQFYGVDAEWAHALTQSVVLKDLPGERPTSLIDQATAFFGGGGKNPPPPPDLVLEAPSAGEPGGRNTVSLFGRDPVRLARAAQSKPTWSQATVGVAETDSLAWFEAHPEFKARRGARSSHPTVVVVAFPKASGEVQLTQLAAVAEMSQAAAPSAGPRLQALLKQQLQKATATNASLATMVSETKARIQRELNPQDVAFYVESNLGDLRMAETDRNPLR